MARGRMKIMWDQTVELVCLISNMMRDKKHRKVEHWEVHPFRQRIDYMKSSFNVEMLKAVAHNGRKQQSNQSR